MPSTHGRKGARTPAPQAPSADTCTGTRRTTSHLLPLKPLLLVQLLMTMMLTMLLMTMMLTMLLMTQPLSMTPGHQCGSARRAPPRLDRRTCAADAVQESVGLTGTG